MWKLRADIIVKLMCQAFLKLERKLQFILKVSNKSVYLHITGSNNLQLSTKGNKLKINFQSPNQLTFFYISWESHLALLFYYLNLAMLHKCAIYMHYMDI